MNKQLRSVLTMAALAVGFVVAPGVSVPAANAAPVTVGGCSTASGSTDTGALRITIDDAAFAGGAMVPIHDRTGGVTFPAPKDDAMSSPMCGAQRLADGSLRYDWLYCTDPVLNTCATDPLVRKGLTATGVAALSDLDKARLAWLLDVDIDNSTAATRVESQRLVWCVTEGYPAKEKAPEYYKNGTDDPRTKCPDWPAIDPTLATSVNVAIAGPTGTVGVGQPARFAVTTDVSPLTLGVVGLTGMTLCPGVAGATLAGDVLTIATPDPAAPVAVCATRMSGGTGTLTATVSARTGRTLEFWQRNDEVLFCQGMLSASTLSTAAAAASAQAVFAADTTPTTTTVAVTTTVAEVPTSIVATTTIAVGVDGGSTSTQPTVQDNAVTPRTLPRTGGSGRSMFDVGWALVLAGIGVLLVTAARRPARR